MEKRFQEKKEVLPFTQEAAEIVAAPKAWPDVLEPRKRKAELAMPREEEAVYQPRDERGGREGNTVRKILQSYLRMRDVGRIMRMGLSDPPGDGRGWAAVALVHLKRYKEAAQLAAGPDGRTPCCHRTLRFVAQGMAKAGAIEAALHLSSLVELSAPREDEYITPGSRVFQTSVECAALYLQATADNMPRLMAAHGQQMAFVMEKLLKEQEREILSITPNRRYRMLTAAFNQIIRWYGRARLVPQALRACEIMNELGIPRDDMTIHFLSKGAAQQCRRLKRAKQYTQATMDQPGRRPEVVFIGRTNSGKSAIINALLSSFTKMAPSSKTRAWTRWIDWYEVNNKMAGLPYFCMVDTPGLGHANVRAGITRDWPDLIYSYLSQRQSLVHVFHLCDARNKKLLPADKTLIHLLAKAQRRRVRFTIVITKIDTCPRKLVRFTANNIREELAPYVDVDIMYASSFTLRGIDHLWAKIWQSVTETPRGGRHRDIGMKELQKLYSKGPGGGIPKENDLADLMGYTRAVESDKPPEDFDSEVWQEDKDFKQEEAGKSETYFNDKWGEDLAGEEDDDGDLEEEMAGGGPVPSLSDLKHVHFGGDSNDDAGDEDDADDELDFLGSEDELEKRWADQPPSSDNADGGSSGARAAPSAAEPEQAK